MASVVDLCNRALSKLGQPRITALTDDNKAARACNHAYEFVRDAVLRDHPWNCAITRAQLAPDVSTPVFEFDFQYTWPSDCLRILELDTTHHWRVEGKKILTNEGSVLNVRYIKRETDPNVYDVSLREAISSALAFELAEEITQSNTKKEALSKAYRELLVSVRRADAQEGSYSGFKEDAWINVRL